MADETTGLHLRSAQISYGIRSQTENARDDDLYEDAAEVIVNNLSKSGLFSRHRVGVALPRGVRKYKAKEELPHD